MAYGNPHKSDYSSSKERLGDRIKRYGGKAGGDAGTKRAGRMESRMELIRKHRAQRRTARKEGHLYTPLERGKMKAQMKEKQRGKRRAMFKSQGIVNRRTPSQSRTALRTRATERGSFQRAGQAAGRGQPQRTSYGGEQAYGRGTKRGDALRKILQD